MDHGPPTAPSAIPLTAPLPAVLPAQLPVPAMIAAVAPGHAMLVAGVAVRQASTYTATLAERIGMPQVRADMRGALVAMFVAGDDREAAALRGSFHPRVAQATGARQS